MKRTIKEMREILAAEGINVPGKATVKELETFMDLLEETAKETKEEAFEVVAEFVIDEAGTIVDEEVTYPATPTLEPKPAEALPSEDRWAQMERIANAIASSTLIASPLRNNPTDVLLVLLAAHDLGIPSTQALAKLHVVDGKLAMSAEMMVALVLRDGHELWADDANDHEHQIAYGRRKGSAEVTRSEFTIADARTAGLADRTTWKKYPRSMLWARAVSTLCRQAFPDSVAGVSYTPDELAPTERTLVVGEESEGKSAAPKQAATPAELPAEVVEGIKELGNSLVTLKQTSPVEAEELRRQWKESGLPPLKSLKTLDELETVEIMLAEIILSKPFE